MCACRVGVVFAEEPRKSGSLQELPQLPALSDVLLGLHSSLLPSPEHTLFPFPNTLHSGASFCMCDNLKRLLQVLATSFTNLKPAFFAEWCILWLQP